MIGTHPVLSRLDVLVGRWTVQVKVDGVGPSWTEFTWTDDGMFLRQHSDSDPVPSTAPQAWQDNSPFPITTMIGFDDASEELTMLYADARGVHRVYRMSFTEGVWRIWRDAAGFNQRFTGTLSPDGQAMDGRWEMSPDGVSWGLDFELTYTRAG